MYQALYRKYRPKKFNEIVSQNAIITTLQNAVKTGHINHAYLFSGPRGTGKTTVAKIFARLVNCEENNGNLCEACPSCLYSEQKECMDIIEIDAASNNGVDEIRNLRDKVSVLPTQLRYKVYIIDEVHMLSIGAFNALLKTLEEPPQHVIFILATTDPQKIPATIISRCQCYQFKKITSKEISKQLKKISESEHIDVEDDVLDSIAIASDGGLRDAIGLLDKVISYQTEHITMDDFLIINGTLSKQELHLFENSIFSHKMKNMLEIINEYYNDGKDLVQILKQLMSTIKNQLVDYYLYDVSLNYDEQEMIDLINLLNEKIFDIKKSDDIKMYIEIMLLHFINQKQPEIEEKNSKIISREIISDNPLPKKDDTLIVNQDERLDVNKNIEPLQSIFSKFQPLMEIRARNIMLKAQKLDLVKEIENWKKLEDFTFDKKCGYLACELLDGKPRAASNDGLIVSYEYESLLEKMSTHFDKLESFYQNVSQTAKKISFISELEWKELRQQYIKLIKEGKNFDYQPEPLLETEKKIKEEKKKETEETDQKVTEALALFGDIVEVN